MGLYMLITKSTMNTNLDSISATALSFNIFVYISLKPFMVPTHIHICTDRGAWLAQWLSVYSWFWLMGPWTKSRIRLCAQ